MRSFCGRRDVGGGRASESDCLGLSPCLTPSLLCLFPHLKQELAIVSTLRQSTANTSSLELGARYTYNKR